MAQTVGFAILGALILSLTYVPMVSSLFLSRDIKNKRTFSDRMMEFFQRKYLPIIHWTLKKKKSIVAISLVLFLGSVFVFSRLGGEFIPTLEEGDFAFHSILPQGSSISESIENNARVEKILLRFPEVKRVVAKSGAPDIPTDPMPPEATDMMIILKDKEDWVTADTKEELMDTMIQALKVIPGVFYEATQPIQMRFNELMTGVRQDVAVKIFGENLDSLLKYGEQVETLIQGVEGASEPQLERVNGLPQIVINYKRENLALYNISISEVNRIVRAAFAGEVAGQVFENERRFDLVVRMEKNLRTDIESLKKLLVPLPSGSQIPLEQLALIQIELGPAQISREEAKRRIVIGFNVMGRDVQSVVQDLQKKMDEQLKLPPGYYITYGGQFQNLVQASNRLMITVPIALLLIFLLLYLTFNSTKEAFLIYSAIPLSAIGGVLALWLRGMPFSISAGVGFIALFGVAVLNGIVLISTFNELETKGLSLYDRVIEGTKSRLRPVLMTALVASLGFLPMALSSSAGAEVQKPLATVVIGGLFSATILTLVVLPSLYILFNNFKKTGKPSHIIKGISIALVLSFFQTEVVAQDRKEIPLDSAISMALSNNNLIKSADKRIDLSKQIRATSSDIGNTNVSFMYGQYNSYYNDNSFTIGQTIPFPTFFKAQANLYDAATVEAQKNKVWVENDLRFELRKVYNALHYSKEFSRLLLSQDSIYQRFLNYAELRFSTGEISNLELISAQTKVSELRNGMAINQMEIQNLEARLKMLMNSKESYTSVNSNLDSFSEILVFDTTSANDNPQLQILQQKILLSQAQLKVEKAKLYPEFSIGYFNQSLFGTVDFDNNQTIANASTRFQGISVGVAIPIWAKPQSSRIKAAKIQAEIASIEAEGYSNVLSYEYQVLFNNYQRSLSTLAYFNESALKNAEVLTKNSILAYEAGEISYFELMSGLERALAINTEFTKAKNENNQAIIDILFLIGK